MSFIKSSNARWRLYPVHFTFYSFRSNARVKQCDRRVFLTCPSIPNTNRVRDYILGQSKQQFRGLTEDEMLRIFLNLLRRCIKRIHSCNGKNNYFHTVKDENIPFNPTPLRWMEHFHVSAYEKNILPKLSTKQFLNKPILWIFTKTRRKTHTFISPCSY